MGLMEAERQRFDSLLMHTPHGDYALPPALDLLDLRLPRALRAALARLRRPLRDGEGERPRAPGQRRRRDRGRDRPRRRSRAPLVVDALGWRRMLASGDGYQPPDAPLSRGLEVHPERRGRGPRGLDRPPLRPRRLRLVASRPATSCGSASAPSTPASTSARRPSCSPRTSDARPRPLPGQLDPAQAAPRHRGRRLLRRRLGRPLPAADRRGDPHRALLRDRPGPRAARRRRGPAGPRAGAPPATPSSTTRTSGSSAGCCACSGSSHGSRRACSGRSSACSAPSASSTGPSTTTCGSRRRSSRPSANDQNGAGQQQHDADHALGAERDLVEAEQAEPVDRHRGGELAGDRRRRDAAGADRRRPRSARWRRRPRRAGRRAGSTS